METPILIPRPGDARPYKSVYEKWRREHDAAHPAPAIENVRFEHDPRWRARIFSIQNAHDRTSIVWKATQVLLIVGDIAWVAWRCR